MTITFDIKKNNTKKNPSNAKSASKALDALILSKLMGTKKPEPKKDTIKTFTFEPAKPKKNPLLALTKPAHKEPQIDFFTAFSAILSSPQRDTYDFKLADGTPVKLFSDEIQIGYDLYDLNDGTRALYDMLSEDRRQDIIDIYINITRK